MYSTLDPKFVTSVFCIAVCFPTALFADDWPQFLGKHRNGISAETVLIGGWPDGGPKIAWEATVGEGMSGCAIVDGKLVTMAQDAANQYVICLGVADGTERWRTPISARYDNGQGNGPRATPTIVDGSVYVYSGDGVLARLKLADGGVVWKINVCKEYGGKPAEYGLSCSPLVAEGGVVVTFDSDPLAGSGPTICLRADDGTLNWKAVPAAELQREQPGYSSPVLMSLDGKPHVVGVNGSNFQGFELASGRLMWNVPFKTDYACNTASPVIVGEKQVFISAGENHGCALFAVGKPDGVKEIWSSLGPKSVMRNEWQTSILDGDFLYGFDNIGSAGAITNLCCVNWKTGEQAWIERRFGKGNLISAEGKLWMSNMAGEMIVAKVDPEKYVELGRTKVTDTTRQAPSLAGGFLYFRGKQKVVCVDVRVGT